MSEEVLIPERIRDLIDAYLEGVADADGLAELEAALRESEAVRVFFAKYSQAHTDLHLELAARAATERALGDIPSPPVVPAAPRPVPRGPSMRSVWPMAAASLFLGVVIGGGVVGLFAAPAGPSAKPPVPRTLSLTFGEPYPGALADAAGAGTGFTHRLPGTGGGLPAKDPNLQLVPGKKWLDVTATASDLNTRYRLDQAEFPGVSLSRLGFTGDEDFEVVAKVADVPAMTFVGQFGVYAGVTADWATRGGLVSQAEPDSYRQFVVNTRDGRDKDAYFVGLGAPGDDLHIRLSRLKGKFTMAVENRTSGATSTLAIRHPEFLNGRGDIVVGVFASDPRGEDRHKPVHFAAFSATVWVPANR